ncbi:molecular chaperone DnaJ [Novosphingobium sp. 1949]|uniref:Molecular chaperone DnaJ n=1 Tax=Novosphingobium organovorum TaxID=2930092 RepID=A0ABT0B9F4_9SPHN|nr:molecular chaperone DnaJ [Novosphingobium organovorum]MCJ2181488.1 molecular chaperone DnaJ [Novosphingobium organovorum]
MKLLWILVLAAIAWRMGFGRWPWQSLGISSWPDKPKPRASFAEVEARALLGVASGAGRKEILEAHRRHLAAVHPDRGGSSEQVHAANAARDTLLAALGRDGS